MKLLYDKDADLGVLSNKKIAVIGYGAQGRAQALMLRDSGVDVIVGVREARPSYKQAQEDGNDVTFIKDAAEKADIIHILIPDEIQAAVYKKDIKDALTPGKVLSFSHGFNIVFKKIVPPKGVDVIMVAPKAPGTEERKQYLEGFGVPALIAINRNESGKAKDMALAMAKAMKFTKAGVLECTFEQEAYEDLFGEQTVLCGGVTELIKAGFETLTEAGYPPEMAYFECLHEMKLIVDLIYEGGIGHMYNVVSNTAEYGGRSVGPKIIGKEAKKNMKEVLKKVENGEFAKEWLAEYENGLPNMKKWREEEKNHDIEKVGEEIRKLFKK